MYDYRSFGDKKATKDDRLKKILEMIREYAEEEKASQVQYSCERQKETFSFSYRRVGE